MHLYKGDDHLFVHSKSHWSNIQVGCDGRMVRFGLDKLKVPTQGEWSIETKNQVFLIFEIPPDFEIIEKYDDENFKGIKMRLKDMKPRQQGLFSMS